MEEKSLVRRLTRGLDTAYYWDQSAVGGLDNPHRGHTAQLGFVFWGLGYRRSCFGNLDAVWVFVSDGYMVSKCCVYLYLYIWADVCFIALFEYQELSSNKPRHVLYKGSNRVK
jgi:hypothetical protein